MKKTIKKSTILAALLVAAPGIAAAQGLIGDCADCHTMHNSEQGAPVAMTGVGGGTISSDPIPNLLKMDCMACHAQNGTEAIVDFGGGSLVPQVYHTGSTDLAGGNFAYIDTMTSSRKGHNVIDLFTGGDDNSGTTGSPPGKYRSVTHGTKFSAVTTYDNFTCAGSVGCHGTRSQMLSGDTDPATNAYVGVRRRGLAAISGAHHESYDGAKDAVNPDSTYTGHSGQMVADGYRFIPGLKGYGNTVDRWQNVDANSHNEYYGATGGTGTGCNACHAPGTAGTGVSARMTYNSTLRVPNNSMSGFCATCHGMFHSSGGGTDLQANGVSTAFLRHPSDFVIPAEREYAAYTAYDITAPVARPTLYTAADSQVYPGADLVMCLSCHMAHGSEHDYMLRFDYTTMDAGGYSTIADGQAAGGCLACHTTKGTLPENR